MELAFGERFNEIALENKEQKRLENNEAPQNKV